MSIVKTGKTIRNPEFKVRHVQKTVEIMALIKITAVSYALFCSPKTLCLVTTNVTGDLAYLKVSDKGPCIVVSVFISDHSV